MKKYKILFLALTGIILNHWCCKDSKQDVRIISKSRTVSMPVQMLSNTTPESLENPAALTVSAGGEDELPQGPQSFDVLDDGSFVITDPLQRRIVFYNSMGQYLEAWQIGFPANRIKVRDDGFFEVTKATSNDTFLIDDTGQIYPANMRTRSQVSKPSLGETKLLGLNRGVISRPRTRGQEPGTLEINFESDSTQMISLRDLGMDREGNTYVAMETTHGTDTIDIIKFIRKYSPKGNILGQINDISLDYYIHPVDEFRIKNGQIYQMQPKQTELLINIW